MAVVRKEMNKTKYIAVFIITTLIFIVGIFIGNYFSNAKLAKISDMQQDLRTQTLSMEIQYEFAAQNPCLVNSTPLTDELYTLGARLDYMEGSLGKKNEQVKKLKEYYHLLEIRQWLFLKEAQKKCNTSNYYVIYFYSNAGDCDKCEEQGYVLSYIRKKFSSVNIYSFDINIDNPAINILKITYEISEAPTLIIAESSYSGFRNSQDVEEILFPNQPMIEKLE